MDGAELSRQLATELGLPAEHVARDWERRWFQRCRRAWDFTAPGRRNLVPVPGLRFPGSTSAGIIRAIRDALAVYYFPGMWGWDRAIVRELTRKALHRTVDTEMARIRTAGRPVDESTWEQARHEAELLLADYFEWAPTVDRLEPIRVEVEFDVPLPHPDDPDRDLAASDGGRCRYGGRIDMLVIDHTGATWVVAHRVRPGRHATPAELVMDDDLLSKAWAWQRTALDAHIAGTVYNEVGLGPRLSENPDESLPPEVVRTEAGPFRRTWIPRDQASYAAVGRIIGDQALEMADPTVRVYPSPGPDVCGECAYLAPCRTMFQGIDPKSILSTAFTDRPDLESEPGRLGNVTWSLGRGAAPPRFRSVT